MFGWLKKKPKAGEIPIPASASGRAGDARHHWAQARAARKAGDSDMARLSFIKAGESLRQAKQAEPDQWDTAASPLQEEFRTFVQNDPAYQAVMPLIRQTIRDTPGILQTDIYKALPDVPRESVSYVLYFAADLGEVRREKKGRSYAVYPST